MFKVGDKVKRKDGRLWGDHDVVTVSGYGGKHFPDAVYAEETGTWISESEVELADMKMEYKVGKWYGWNGGECPVHPETVVQVVWLSDQNEYTDLSVNMIAGEAWDSEVIAFRIINEHKEPREWWVWAGLLFCDVKDAEHECMLGNGDMSNIIHVREVLPND